MRELDRARKVKSRVIPARLRSHMGIGPAMQDLNIAATATGPGARETSKLIRTLREREVGSLGFNVPSTKRLDLGNKRVSRHAIKRLQELYDASKG